MTLMDAKKYNLRAWLEVLKSSFKSSGKAGFSVRGSSYKY